MKVEDIEYIKTFETINPKDTRYLNHVVCFSTGHYMGRFCRYDKLWRELNEVCN